ncbi:unnamed protein product [Echinostoma caproni]|uniref:Uncharacterized protein n=1 Tax=Echinostoma caproni TaxID=27848 RepID=A0A183A0Z4_9TREM|nr:unnamed protein product [Echinostoma caproni]
MDASLQSTTNSLTMPSVIGSQCEQTSTAEAIVSADIPSDAGLEFTRWAGEIRRSLAEVRPDIPGVNLELIDQCESTSVSPSSAGAPSPPHREAKHSPSPPDHSAFHLNFKQRDETQESFPCVPTFSFSPVVKDLDFGVSLSFGPMLTSTQQPDEFDWDKENLSDVSLDWNGELAGTSLPTSRPVISWPEPVPQFASRSGKRLSAPDRDEHDEEGTKRPVTAELCSKKNTIDPDFRVPGPAVSDWKARASSKLVRFSALGSMNLPEIRNADCSTPSTSVTLTAQPIPTVSRFGLKRLCDVQLTNEDFEIDL